MKDGGVKKGNEVKGDAVGSLVEKATRRPRTKTLIQGIRNLANKLEIKGSPHRGRRTRCETRTRRYLNSVGCLTNGVFLNVATMIMVHEVMGGSFETRVVRS